MSQQHTYEEIANDYRLWIEFVDVDASMTEEEFNALSTDEKIRLQVEAFGKESK